MDTTVFSKRMTEMKRRAPTVAGKVADAISKKILDEVIKRSPKKTGKYSKGWKIERVDATKRKITHPNKKLVEILEFTGSSGAHIEGDPLAFEVDGEMVFVKFANPKGFRPIPHLRPAIKQVRQESRSIAKQVWAKEGSGFK